MSLDLTLQHQYSGFSLELNTTIPATGITALFGPSGSGKTSLLRFIAGLDKPDSGEISWKQQPWHSKPHSLSTQQRRVGMVFQEPSLFAHLSVRQNISFSPRCNGDLEHWIKSFGLESLLDRMPNTLSGGEKQRVAIVRALASQPELLLMDEPLSGLDEAAKSELLPYLEQLRDELDIPVIYVSHSIAEVARLADHIVAMDNGCVVAQGSAAAVLTNPELPLAHGADAGALLDAKVLQHCTGTAITTLKTTAGELQIPANNAPSKQRFRIHIAARDVSIATQAAQHSSILNCLPATVQAITPESSSQALISLTVNGATLLARITRKSVSQLDLQCGQTVYAQIKGIALYS